MLADLRPGRELRQVSEEDVEGDDAFRPVALGPAHGSAHADVAAPEKPVGRGPVDLRFVAQLPRAFEPWTRARIEPCLDRRLADVRPGLAEHSLALQRA